MALGEKAYRNGVPITSSQTNASPDDNMNSGFSENGATGPSDADASGKFADESDQKFVVGGRTDTKSAVTNASQSGEGYPTERVVTQTAPMGESQGNPSNGREKRTSGAQRRRRNRERNAILGENDGQSFASLTSDSIERILSSANQGTAKAEDNRSICSESTQVSLGRRVSTLRGENDHEIVSRLQHSSSEAPSETDVLSIPAAGQNDRLSQVSGVGSDMPRASDVTVAQTDEPAPQESAVAAPTKSPINQLDDSWEIKDVMLEGQRLSRKLKSATEEIERHSTARTRADEQIKAAHDEIARLTHAIAVETAAIERKENERQADRARLNQVHQILGLD